MTLLRAGTRGSDLALWQTRWVCERLRAAHPSLRIEEVVIKTHGDSATEQLFDADWPVGGFVGAIEQALSARRIEFAVHSFKDLQTAATPGLVVAAVPAREVVYDVLVTRELVELDSFPAGFRLGTSSPRRSAQFRRFFDVQVVPIRGNVPTRVAKIQGGELDGVVLAGAGVKRLALTLDHVIELPTDRFVPAPAQGALAIQTRAHDAAQELVAVLDDATARRLVAAERSFLAGIQAGCHVPVAALARPDGSRVRLHAQLFSPDGAHVAETIESGDDPESLGLTLARRLLAELGHPM